MSCGLLSARDAPRNTWGGARNRADRESWHLSERQCRAILTAAKRAMEIGLPFNRHWTVHCERAGITETEGAKFVGRLLSQLRRYARGRGGGFAAVWVREDGDGKGGHVHILMHLPAGMTLRNRTRRWIDAAGGRCRQGVSKVRSIGGALQACNRPERAYEANLGAVVAYMLKGASEAAGEALGLARYGECGRVVGKRSGWTQNVGEAARRNPTALRMAAGSA